MPFNFELHTDRPILVNTSDLQGNSDEIAAMADEAKTWLDRLDHRVYYIINLGNTRLDLGNLMNSAEFAARGSAAPLHHPNIIEAMVVTTDPLIVMAAKSVNSYLFGNLHLRIFSTLDQALSYVGEKVTS